MNLSLVMLSYTLIGNALYPEGIAYLSSTDTFFVGSAADGSLQTVTNGVAASWQAAGTDGRTETLGIKIDEGRDRIWLAGDGAVFVYKLSTNVLLKKLPLAAVVTVENAALNDIALTADGSAYITDSFNPHLLRVDGASLEMTVFRQLTAIPYGRQNNFRYNLNGIVPAPDGRSLISVKTNDGTLWRISLFDSSVTQIQLTEPVTKGDGLVWGPDSHLYVIRNFENRVSRIDMGRGCDSEARQVNTVEPANLNIPTTGVFLAAPPRLVIVNSQFGKEPPSLPFTLSEIPIEVRGLTP